MNVYIGKIQLKIEKKTLFFVNIYDSNELVFKVDMKAESKIFGASDGDSCSFMQLTGDSNRNNRNNK